jgi:hypothetical protein
MSTTSRLTRFLTMASCILSESVDDAGFSRARFRLPTACGVTGVVSMSVVFAIGAIGAALVELALEVTGLIVP